MNIVLQSNNSLHRYDHADKEDERIHYTFCGIKFAGIGSKCPQDKYHKIIYPNCILHTKPTKCKVCFV
jgi:hypothetical protein